jgi:hypothetical protein
MEIWRHDGADIDSVIARHGPWSAMAVHLGDGRYTRDKAPDPRLKRLVQIAADACGKPLSECRVADLACLEAHYAIEFALHGAEAVGVEIRPANLAKAAYAADALRLDRLTLYRDDVRNFSAERYGQFDIIICSGILYHLRGADVLALMRSMREACRGILLLDTFIALKPTIEMTIGDVSWRGALYKEHDEGASDEEKERDLWASIDNETSFWFTEAALTEAAQRAGFTSFCQVLLPTHPGVSCDRRTYLGFVGEPVRIRSSEPTDALVHAPAREFDPNDVHPSQAPRSQARRFAARALPKPVKEALKPVLRAIGVLDAGKTPDFLKKK